MTKNIIITKGLIGNRKSIQKTITYKNDRGLKTALLKIRGASYNAETGIWKQDDIAFSTNNDKWIIKRNGENLCIPSSGYLQWNNLNRVIL